MSFVQINRVGENHSIANVSLNRPEARNAFHTEMAQELLDTFRELVQTDSRVVLLTSTSEKAFCSGADLKERYGMSEARWREQHHLFEQMFNAIADLPQPVIAVVDGYALAGGFELVLNCDLIVAADTAVFGLPEVTRGIMPGGGGNRLLARRIGVHRAKEWLCTGRMVTAKEAEAAGLLNRLTSRATLQEEAMDLAEMIARNAPIAVQQCKRAVETLFGMEIAQAREEEIRIYNKCVDTEDRLEGVRAFTEKRLPRFIGK